MKYFAVLALCAFFGVALVVAQAPSAFPTVQPSPSAFWGRPYWAASYGDVVTGGNTPAITNGASAALYYPLSDLPTHSMVASEVVVGANGVYLSMEMNGISLDQRDQFAVSGKAISLVSYDSSLLISQIIPAAGQSVAHEFWFLPTFGSVATLNFNYFTVSVTPSGVTVLDATNTIPLITSAPNAITINKYAHVIVAVSTLHGSDRTVRLYVDGVAQSEIEIDATALVAGSVPAYISGAGVYLDEVAQYVSSAPFALSQSDINLRFVVGELRACRCRPCFSAANCVPLGAESFQCGACPAGYTGDGETCTPNGPPGPCGPLPHTEVGNPYYCADNCNTLSKCMECSMNFVDLDQTRARLACSNDTIPSFAPSASSTSAPSASSTSAPSASSTVAPSVSGTPAVTPSTSLIPVVDPCSPNPCSTGYRCRQTGPSSHACDDIDECTEAPITTCPAGTYCNNLPGTVECHDINECLNGTNGGCADKCLNYYGYSTCACDISSYTTPDGGVTCRYPVDNYPLTLLRSTRIEQGSPSSDFRFLGLSVGYKNKTGASCAANECTKGILVMFDLESLMPTSPSYNFNFTFSSTQLRYLVVANPTNVAKLIVREINVDWPYSATNSTPMISWNTRPTSTVQIAKIPFYFPGNGTVTQEVPELRTFNSLRLNRFKTNFGLYIVSEGNATYTEGTNGYADLGSSYTHGSGADPSMFVSYVIYAYKKPANWSPEDYSGPPPTTTSSV